MEHGRCIIKLDVAMVPQFACGRINKVHRIRSRRSSASTAFRTFETRDGNFDYPALELGVAFGHTRVPVQREEIYSATCSPEKEKKRSQACEGRTKLKVAIDIFSNSNDAHQLTHVRDSSTNSVTFDMRRVSKRFKS